jgi:hypothetical protein
VKPIFIMKLQTLMIVREERRRRLIQSEQKTTPFESPPDTTPSEETYQDITITLFENMPFNGPITTAAP